MFNIIKIMKLMCNLILKFTNNSKFKQICKNDSSLYDLKIIQPICLKCDYPKWVHPFAEKIHCHAGNTFVWLLLKNNMH